MHSLKKSLTKSLALVVMLALLFCNLFTGIPASAAARGAWAPNTAYAVTDTVTYSGSTYTCRQAHTSLVGWEPSNVPALWEKGGGGTTPPPTTPPTNGVIFYADINYGGTAITLGVGNYTLSQLNAKGIPNDWMSSLKVPGGWTVEVYEHDNFGGTKWTYTSSSSWVGSTVNDKMSSVKIYTGSPTPSVTKPSEVPSSIWTYTMNVDNKFGKGGDFALLLCAVIKKESSFGAGLPGSPSAGDGLMQVEPNTRNAYLSQFSSKFGRAYNHSSEQDQVCMGAMILDEKIAKFGNIYNGLLHYNGGDYWYPGATDSYGRPILANQYADAVYATYKGYGGKN
ncbi:transglycosylase-like protein with SLT domain [Mobilisporobacter senegalensis]|uniref:Transglycosylase-like protein with SLT domain n=1 Tax=Mobilisporobacter senegalensis TaxID=1329262 RepID=A0A3N1XUW4_9FIRM|nr:carbohydrate-binding protein [Mobilisporobacter senegalensis]ROR30403.1 transglycosylase-like protein with SLT domain [Mobilisporobacter senegalensis]